MKNLGLFVLIALATFRLILNLVASYIILITFFVVKTEKKSNDSCMATPSHRGHFSNLYKPR